MLRVEERNTIPDLLKELEYIDNHEVQIGIFGEDNSFMVMIARIHEFGATIKPKGKYLTLPLKPELRDVSPRELPDKLFVPKGTKILARKANNAKGFEALYALLEEVTIPERSFIRSTFDENKNKLEKHIETLLQKVIDGQMTGHAFLEKVGLYFEGKIKKQIKDIKTPGKAPATLSLEGADKNNPLIDTGRMRKSVTYKVVSR